MSKPHKCPVCDGTGKVSRPPWQAGDVDQWLGTSTAPYPCNACNGSGIVWELEFDIKWPKITLIE